MTAPTLWYVNGLRTMARAGLGIAPVTGTLKAMFVKAAYVPDQDNHDFIDDVNANEATGTGVAAGGVTLASVTVTATGATNTVSIDAADITGISVTCCYVVLYVSTGTAGTSPVISITDLSEGTATDAVWTGVTWGALGIVGLTAA
jgi:hypothetical protein